MTENPIIKIKTKLKEILYFINAHRDGCSGDLIKESLQMSDQETIDYLTYLFKEDLISFANETEIDNNNIMNLLIMITGAYTHQDYKDIF
jgi:hypothetical protein